MSEREEGDRLASAPHPREQMKLFGHEAAEVEILAAFNGGRMPHALLIGGAEGIGKATFAYRLARFLFSAPEAGAKSLEVAPDHPAARQVAALSHPDLIVLRRIATEEGKKPPTEIPIDMVRRAIAFFGSTAAMGGWRIGIVDSVDELNVNGTNALLKILEEPPARSLFLLVSHAPGRVIATIRSRCQKLSLRPLSEADVVKAVDSIADRMNDFPRNRVREAAAASGGSVRRAIALLLGEGLEVRNLTADLLAKLPAVDGEALHKLGDKLYGGDALYVFAEVVEDWLAEAATKKDGAPARLARFAETWENVRRAATETDIYNLDRKPLVFQVFSMLAEATR